MYMLLQNN